MPVLEKPIFSTGDSRSVSAADAACVAGGVAQSGISARSLELVEDGAKTVFSLSMNEGMASHSSSQVPSQCESARYSRGYFRGRTPEVSPRSRYVPQGPDARARPLRVHAQVEGAAHERRSSVSVSARGYRKIWKPLQERAGMGSGREPHQGRFCQQPTEPVRQRPAHKSWPSVVAASDHQAVLIEVLRAACARVLAEGGGASASDGVAALEETLELLQGRSGFPISWDLAGHCATCVRS